MYPYPGAQVLCWRCGLKTGPVTVAEIFVSHTAAYSVARYPTLEMVIICLHGASLCDTEAEPLCWSVQSMADAEGTSSDNGNVDGQALAQIESIQMDVQAALAAARDAQGSGPVLQDSLAKVTTLLETMVREHHHGVLYLPQSWPSEPVEETCTQLSKVALGDWPCL